MPDLPDNDQPLNQSLSQPKTTPGTSSPGPSINRPANQAGRPQLTPPGPIAPGLAKGPEPTPTQPRPLAGSTPTESGLGEASPSVGGESTLGPKPALPQPEPMGKEEPLGPPLKTEELAPPASSGTSSLVKPAGEETEVFRVQKSSPVTKGLLIVLILSLVAGLGWAFYRFVLPRFGTSKEVTLTYWGLWETEEVMKEIITEWEAANPKIKVNYSRQSPQEYRERVQSALARGEGPDIFRFHNTWLPMFKDELDSIPAEVMDGATFEKTFYPVAVSSLRSGVGYLGIPLEVDTLALFYNEDIFTAAGVSPPKTWDELRQLASQLTLRDENGLIQRAGVALGTTGNLRHWPDILGLMMLQNGADLTNPTGSLAEDALTFYTLFSTTDRVWDETLPASLIAFATGKTAMFFGYSWDVFEIQATNPDLNFKIVPVPQLPGTDIGWASFWVEGVAAKSDYQEEAWQFLQFLSSKETMGKLYQAASKTRLFGEPYSRVAMASQLQTDPLLAPFLNQAPKAETWYLCSHTFDNGINDRIIKYFEDAVNAVNGGETPRKTLPTVASGVAQILSQYGLGSQTVR